jgi:hypothetical protein
MTTAKAAAKTIAGPVMNVPQSAVAVKRGLTRRSSPKAREKGAWAGVQGVDTMGAHMSICLDLTSANLARGKSRA